MSEKVSVTKEQLDDMRHAIGLNYKDKPYRNRFVTSINCSDWNDLVDKGLAKKAKSVLLGPEQAMFWLTKEGVEFTTGKRISQKEYDEL